MTVTDRIDALIAGRKLLDHPFYTTWSQGTLTRDALTGYAEQYYRWVDAFPTFLSAIHSNCSSLAARQIILANLADEECGPHNHAELWLRFCDALGLDRASVRRQPLLPETARAIATFRDICRNRPVGAALAAIYAYESQQPEVMASKRLGLTRWYGIVDGHDYFATHETIDVHHSAAERRLIEEHLDGDAEPALAAVRTALDATYTLLDGIHDRYVAGPTRVRSD